MLTNLWKNLQHNKVYSKREIARRSGHMRQFFRSKVIKRLFDEYVFEFVGNGYLVRRDELWWYVHELINNKNEEICQFLDTVDEFVQTYTVIPMTWKNFRLRE